MACVPAAIASAHCAGVGRSRASAAVSEADARTSNTPSIGPLDPPMALRSVPDKALSSPGNVEGYFGIAS